MKTIFDLFWDLTNIIQRLMQAIIDLVEELGNNDQTFPGLKPRTEL